MNRTVVIISTVFVLICCLAAIVILTALKDDSTSVIGFIMAGIIPTVTSLFAFKEASKASENTNGILHKALAEPSDGPLHKATGTDTTDGKGTTS